MKDPRKSSLNTDTLYSITYHNAQYEVKNKSHHQGINVV